MSETTQIILVHAKQLPRPIWLDSEVVKGSYALYVPYFHLYTAYVINEHL